MTKFSIVLVELSKYTHLLMLMMYQSSNNFFCLITGSFFTRFASEIESDPVGDYTRAKAALQMLDIDPDTVTTEDLSSLRYVCEVVSRRASFMASAGITALLKKMDYKDVTIAIDGSLFRYVNAKNRNYQCSCLSF